MLQELYRAITTRIEIEENSSEDLSLRFSSDCNKKQSKRRTKCSNIPLGTPVEFTVNITLKACKDQLVTISPVGMEDTFVISVEAISDCDCNIEGSQGNEYTSEYCDYHGE